VPTPPPWIERELKAINQSLELEWHGDTEQWFLLSRRGPSAAIHGAVGPRDLDQCFIDSVRESIRARDSGASVYDRLMARHAARDRREQASLRQEREWAAQQAAREVDAANPTFRSYALGQPGAPTPAIDTSHRADAIRQAEE